VEQVTKVRILGHTASIRAISGKIGTKPFYIFKAMPRRERFSIAPIGEFYTDLLTVDSWINARTNSTQATSLLCAKLQEREAKIKERVAYLAKKRGISSDDMWMQILKGQAEDLTPDEIVDSSPEEESRVGNG